MVSSSNLYAQDDFPFGSVMQGRAWNNEKYRFGFNGKEEDTEGMGGGGSTYDYGFRIYNPSLGNFLSVDPLSKSYSFLTPYQFASNRPVFAIDLDGLEATPGGTPAAGKPWVSPPMSNAPNATAPQSCNGCAGAGPVTQNQQLIVWDYEPDISSKYKGSSGEIKYHFFYKKFRTYNVSEEVNNSFQLKNAENKGKGRLEGEFKRNSSKGWDISYRGQGPSPRIEETTITEQRTISEFIGSITQSPGSVAATNRNVSVPDVDKGNISEISFAFNSQSVQNGITITNITRGGIILDIAPTSTTGSLTRVIASDLVNPGDRLNILNSPIEQVGQGDQLDYTLSISQMLRETGKTKITPAIPKYTLGKSLSAGETVKKEKTVEKKDVVNTDAQGGR